MLHYNGSVKPDYVRLRRGVKNMAGKARFAGLMQYSMIAVLVVGLLAGLASCSVGAVMGSGKSMSETREIEGVTGVELSFLGDLTIKQGDNESLVITGDDNVVPLVKTDVNNHVLSIGTQANTLVQPVAPLRYELTVKQLDSIKLSGLGNISADQMSGDRADIALSGAGKLAVADLQAGDLTVNLSGAGDATLAGEVTKQTVTLSGAGSYNADELKSDVANVSITGLGNAKLWAVEDLSANLTGAGTIEYYGKPSVDQSISGLGSIKSLGNK
jgi:hypothetical protein